jgi:hypothetical protein
MIAPGTLQQTRGRAMLLFVVSQDDELSLSIVVSLFERAWMFRQHTLNLSAKEISSESE